MNPEWNERADRQRRVLEWAVATFGTIAADPRERAARLLEEAVEMAQACGLPLEASTRIVGHVYAKPISEPASEVGGISTCLLALCEVLGVDADDAERAEIARIMALPAEHWRDRQNAKAAFGVGFYCNVYEPCQTEI